VPSSHFPEGREMKSKEATPKGREAINGNKE